MYLIMAIYNNEEEDEDNDPARIYIKQLGDILKEIEEDKEEEDED